jgi:hypothetical protein
MVPRTRSRNARTGSKKRGKRDRKWSWAVTRNSDALDLERNVFTKDNPADIARALQRSAEASPRRKASPFRSAISMLSFYVNRAGTNISRRRRRVLEQAKDELRKAFGRK